MKKTLLLIFSAAFALLLTGCYTNVIDLDDNNGGGGGDPSNNELVISDPTQLNQQIFAEGKLCEVQFTSKQGWNLSYTDEQTQKQWITISPSRSEFGGSFTLSIGVDENQTGDDRTAILQLFSGGENETITINQSSRNEDGSKPLPYEKDVYTDIVEKIVLQYVTNDNIDPWSMEWRFQTDLANGQVNMMELYSIDSDGEKIEEVIVLHDYINLEHNVFGVLQPNNRWDIVLRRHSELVVNANDFIIQQHLVEFNYQDENHPEPIPQHIVHRYANYRHVAEQVNNNTYEYQWRDGNMIEKVEVTTPNTFKFDYGTQDNYRANIDLCSFLKGDMYAAMGLFGKRSKNLLSSIADYKGGVSHFEYSFDEKGRVQTVKQSHSIAGIPDQTSTVFTIHYTNFTDNGGDGSK